jgi:hypothetical protein
MNFRNDASKSLPCIVYTSNVTWIINEKVQEVLDAKGERFWIYFFLG